MRAGPTARQAIATIHASLDAGVTIIDTADAYSLGVHEHGHGEELVAEALAAYGGATDDVLVATKGGHRRPGDGSWTVHGDPAYVKEACEASLKRLGVDAIGLYQYHRPDPKVPWAESVGALADLLDEGKILMAGVSNATVAQIDEAQRVLGGRLVSVQNQFSPRFRSSEGELEHCEKLGIAFIPWSPLGGIGRADAIEQTHPAFAEVAAEVGASPQQVTLAWMLAKGSRVIPIPGQQPPRDGRGVGRGGRPHPDAPSRWPGSTRPERRPRTDRPRARGTESSSRRVRASVRPDEALAAATESPTGSEARHARSDRSRHPGAPPRHRAGRPARRIRPVKSVTDAPARLRGRGLPGPPRLRRRRRGRPRPLHPHGPDGRGRVRARASPRARPGTPTAASRPSPT